MVDSYDNFSIIENTTFTQNVPLKLEDFALKILTIDKYYYEEVNRLIPLLSIKLANAIIHCIDLSKAKLAISNGSSII